MENTNDQLFWHRINQEYLVSHCQESSLLVCRVPCKGKKGVIIVEIIIIGTTSTIEQQGGSREVNLKHDLHMESSIRISIEASYSSGGESLINHFQSLSNHYEFLQETKHLVYKH